MAAQDRFATGCEKISCQLEKKGLKGHYQKVVKSRGLLPSSFSTQSEKETEYMLSNKTAIFEYIRI